MIVSLRKQRYVFCLLIFLVSLGKGYGQEVVNFTDLMEVLQYAKKTNYTFKNAALQQKLAEQAYTTSKYNKYSPKIPVSFQAIDNITQQVSFLPGQIFGGPEGSFREVTIGQQYISTFNIQPQFDIINLANNEQIKSAKINNQLVESQNTLNEYALYEKINGIYFNILLMNAQEKLFQNQIAVANDIHKITLNKFNEGIGRKQEINETEANSIILEDKLSQVQLNRELQYELLNLLLEQPTSTKLSQDILDFEKDEPTLVEPSSINTYNASLQSQLAEQEYKVLKKMDLPVLSFTSSFNWQNLSNDFFFAKKANFINFNFIGLKLTYDLPTTVQKYANQKNKLVQLDLLRNNLSHIEKEEKSNARLLQIEYDKAMSQRINMQRIVTLKMDTYEKSLLQYKENILPLDKLLIAQTEVLASKLNLWTTLSNIGYRKSRIVINNMF